jgi:hypothetical protein
MLPMSGDVALELSVGLSDFTSISAQNDTPAAFSRSHAGSIVTVVETDGVPHVRYSCESRFVVKFPACSRKPWIHHPLPM